MKTNAQRVATIRGANVPSHKRNRGSAFTLLEVMIACGIFFIAIFAILGLVSTCLRNARALRHIEVDAGMVAAQLYKTNRLTEGVVSGDFGDTYREYTWETSTQEAATNGLYQVDIVVRKHGLQNPVDTMSVWIYSPESASTPFNRSPFSNPRR
jgi:type II secretory pathway pseudopilin PulG